MKKDLIKTEMIVKDTIVNVIRINGSNYISLTDLARYANPEEPKIPIQTWMRNKNVISFLGLWEQMYNSNFKGIEFETFENEAGKNSFYLSPQKWINTTNAIGIISKSGNNGGTYAHSDIAFEFASWLSPEFKLYLIQEFERLKTSEAYQERREWDVRRSLSKTNYRIHTDSIKENIYPTLTDEQRKFCYSNEADVLNVALFGKTAKGWKKEHPDAKGNIRDYTSILQLVVLSNLEVINAEMIRQGISQQERLDVLNKTAIRQLEILWNDNNLKKIENNKNNEKMIYK